MAAILSTLIKSRQTAMRLQGDFSLSVAILVLIAMYISQYERDWGRITEEKPAKCLLLQ